MARVVPVVERLAAEGVVVSVDTWKPAVADAGLAAGACMVNDVSGLRDRGVAAACARHGAALVVMHTRAAPKHKDFPAYDDVLADVEAYIDAQLAVARAEGVAEDQLVVDPGPDFAKTPAETVRVLGAIGRLRRFGRPILLAVSRKDFIGALTGTSPRQRGPGTLAAIGEGLDAGAAILRVHDIADTMQFIRVRNALRGLDAVPEDLRLADELRREPGR
jgi:dihydropteroate synthase